MAPQPREQPKPEFEAKDYGPVKFNDWKEVRDAMVAEASTWEWLTAPKSSVIGFSLEDKRVEFLNWVRGARDHLGGYLENNDESVLRSAFRDARRYMNSGLYSKTPRAQVVLSLRAQENGDIVGAAAVALYLGSAGDGNMASQPADARYASQRGRHAMMMFDMGLGDGPINAVSDHTQRIAEDYRARMDRLTRDNTSALNQTFESLEKFKAAHAKAEKQHHDAVDNIIATTMSAKEEAISSINATRAAYTEYMHLAAPVDYWESKGKRHACLEKKRAKHLIIFSAVGTILLAILYFCIGYHAEVFLTNGVKTGAIVVLTAAAAVATTIVFWVARVLQRLYLSERHMAIDASLRSTMVKCYLALLNEGKIDKDERPLVLPPLFRSGSDGIVNDDGVGIEGITALLARYLEKVGK